MSDDRDILSELRKQTEILKQIQGYLFKLSYDLPTKGFIKELLKAGNSREAISDDGQTTKLQGSPALPSLNQVWPLLP